MLLDVNPETGHIKLNFSSLDEMEETCSLDVADRGEQLSRAEVGRLLGKTGESARITEGQGRQVLGQVLYLDPPPRPHLPDAPRGPAHPAHGAHPGAPSHLPPSPRRAERGARPAVRRHEDDPR